MNATLVRRVTLLETFTWHIATLADMVTLPDRPTSQGRLTDLSCKRDQGIIKDFIKDGAKRGKNQPYIILWRQMSFLIMLITPCNQAKISAFVPPPRYLSRKK